MKYFTLSALVSLSALFSGTAVAQTTIENDFFKMDIVSYGTTSSAQMSQIDKIAQESIDYWAQLLSPYSATFNTTDKITISLTFDSLSSGTLGTATSSFTTKGTKSSGDEFYTPVSYEAANGLSYNAINGAQAALMGIVQDASKTDIAITMNRGTNFYYGADASMIGSSQIDFHSVLLHELTHGMGFQSTLFGAPADSESNQYTLDTFQFAGESISHLRVSAYDTLILQNLSGNDPTQLTLGAEIALGDSGFNMYNPADYQDGSSVSHIVATLGSEDFLMQYAIGDGVIRRELTSTEIALFSAMGMKLIPEPSSVLLILALGPACLLRRRRRQA